MAEKNAASSDQSKKQQQSTPLSMPRERLVSSDTASNLSRAELYITQQAQNMDDPNNLSARASSISSSSTTTTQHTERMGEWHNQEVKKLYQNEPYRYKYGTPLSSTFRRDNSQASSHPNQKSNNSKKK